MKGKASAGQTRRLPFVETGGKRVTEPARIARVALSAATYAIDKPYDYRSPPELEEGACPGVRVIVPFGAGNRRTEGIILTTGQASATEKRLKSLVSLLDEAPVLDREGIRLALWMRERFFCTVYEAVWAMLPAGLWFSLHDSYRIAEGIDREKSYQAVGRSEPARRLLDMLWACGGSAERTDIRAAFEGKDPNPTLRQLVERGILTLETSAARGVGDKTEQVAALAMPAEEALSLVTPKRKSAPLRYAVVELLCGIGCASSKEICYFTGASSATLRSLAKSGILTLQKREVFRRAVPEESEPAAPPVLNDQQQAAFAALDTLARSKQAAVALLYGVTGSGKTQVYIQLIRAALKRGQTALVLVPEIALTPQLLHIFSSHFGPDVAVLHSSLRAGERYDEWKRVRSGAARVVLGTRSAVFAPLRNLGLIILDEEQEASYKSENTPRYHARDVAKYRCAKGGGLLVLGSATPSVETMYLAKTGVYHMVSLTRRYNERALPRVYITDLKDELRRGNGGPISALLHRELMANLERGEQSILFLNRRGASRMVAKGLDFENVTLVGVIAADLALYVDSFRAGERTFSLLTQVVGRAGRGEKAGRAVIQTYTPDNEVIRFAAAQDYDSFYEQEIGFRKLMGRPPFQDLFVLTASGVDEAAVLRTCMRLRLGLEDWLRRPELAALGPRLLGPAPASVAKVNNRYRYRLTLCCKNTRQVRALLSHLLYAAHSDRENKGVSVFADVNPYD